MSVNETLSQPPVRKQPTPESKWKAISRERIYGQRLLAAIENARNSTQPYKISPSLAIKEAADSALALTAKGQTRWSRAILSRRWRKRKLWLKAGGKFRRCSASRRLEKSIQLTPNKKNEKKGDRVEDRLRALARLVPGCRKIPTPLLLEEAADYVAALEMQVKAMRTLADLISPAALDSSVHPRTT